MMENNIDAYRKRLFEAQRIAVIQESKEDLTEEQIQERCNELQNQIIDAENINNRFRTPSLQKLFTSGPRFKKVNY